MGKCKHKTGLLSLKDCGETTGRICNKCARPICEKHLQEVNKKWNCEECALKHYNRTEYDERGLDYSYRRNSYYRDYGYYPYYYGSSRRRYGDDDYVDFESDYDDSSYGDEEDRHEIDPEDFQDS